MQLRRALPVLALALASAQGVPGPAGAAADPITGHEVGTNRLLSVRADGRSAGKHSHGGVTSGDGGLVAFTSRSAGVVEGVRSDDPQCYVRDLETGTSALVSRTPDGEPGDGVSSCAAMTPDGRYVVVSSIADDLAGGDPAEFDLFRVDLRTMEVVLLTRPMPGRELGWGGSSPSISDDGRFVAFHSWSRTLVPRDRNGRQDVFVFDVETAATTLVSRSTEHDGTADGTSREAFITADGSAVIFASNADDIAALPPRKGDAIHHDLATGTNQVLVRDDGMTWPRGISPDGRFVLVASDATDLVTEPPVAGAHLFLVDAVDGDVQLVDQSSAGVVGVEGSVEGSVSADGTLVAFDSRASNLVDGDTNTLSDVFLRDVVAGTTSLVSRGAAGLPGDGESRLPWISRTGTLVVYTSSATNLVPLDRRDEDSVIGSGVW